MKIAKTFFFIFLFTLASSSVSQVYWLRQNSPVSVWLYRCSFPDTLNGWACGDSGTIIRTSDGGSNWVIQPTGFDYFVEDINFINKRLGWAIVNDLVAYNTYVLKTTNGGTNWIASLYPDSTIILSTVYFLDSLNGYLGGFNGTILKTTNAGSNWDLMPIDSSLFRYFHIKNFNFFNERIGAACGGIMDFGGVLWLTTNYGFNWHTVTIGPEPIFDIRYLDTNSVIAAGGDFEYGASFSKTHDNWVNWNYNTLGFFGVGQAVAMRTATEIWMPLAFSMSWAVSTDTGNNWTLVENPDSTAIYDAVFADETHGWAVGNFGRVYKFNKAIIGLGGKIKNMPALFELYQNYPNPFNPNTTIFYELRVTSYVRLAVFDITGKEIKTLVHEKHNPGRYKAEFSAQGLASGVYFYRIEVRQAGSSIGNHIETRKMVLVK